MNDPIKIPQTNCAKCNKTLNACASAEHNHVPMKDDVSICFGCGNLALYNEDLSLRAPTVSELKSLKDDPDVLDALESIQQFYKFGRF